MSIKMIMFDLDGTLVDSSVDICNAINYALQGSGGRPVSVEETIRLVGEGITKLFETLTASQEVSLSIEQLVARFLEYYSGHLLDNTTLYPGINETLEALTCCKKALITNKRERSSTRILEAFGIAKYFDLVVGSDTTAERKPSPVPIRFALSKLGISPAESAIVGDSSYDIDAGRAAGITTIAVTYGYRPVDELQKAQYIVNKMSEVPGIIEKLNNK
jgi:phosphoglycolate phosphatase